MSRVEGCSATGIYLTKHSCHACVCIYVCVCLERGRKRERIMVTQAVWLIQMGENTTRLWLVLHTLTHTNPPLLSSSSFSSPLSTRASIQRGQPKEGSRAQITPCLILTGFSLYTKAYKNNERGFGSTWSRVKRRTQPPLLCAKSVTIPQTPKQKVLITD